MKNRSVVGVVLFPFITLGIYSLYWLVSTKGELNAKGAKIPTAWLLIIPLVSIYWLWKYYEGAEQVTRGKVSGVLMFIINLLVTGIISYAICQDAYNNLDEVAQNSPLQGTNNVPVALTPAEAVSSPVGSESNSVSSSTEQQPGVSDSSPSQENQQV
jgi:hypothetical protein